MPATKSRYCLPSTSQTNAPSARAMVIGWAVRTPRGMLLLRSAESPAAEMDMIWLPVVVREQFHVSAALRMVWWPFRRTQCRNSSNVRRFALYRPGIFRRGGYLSGYRPAHNDSEEEATDMLLADFDTLTFDCYGTLIDWES